MEVIFLVAGIALGYGLGFLFFKLKSKNEATEVLVLKAEYSKTEAQMEERIKNLQEDKERMTAEAETDRTQIEQQMQRLAKAEVEFANMREKLATQKQEIEELQKKFTTEFENIANKILEKNSEKFTAANQKNIGDV